MHKKLLCFFIVAKSAVLLSPLHAQLSPAFTLNLSNVNIPGFANDSFYGALKGELPENFDPTLDPPNQLNDSLIFHITMDKQSLNSSLLKGDGHVYAKCLKVYSSSKELDCKDSSEVNTNNKVSTNNILEVYFSGKVKFSATALLAGTNVQLIGAKSGVVWTNETNNTNFLYYDRKGAFTKSGRVTNVAGGFGFKPLTITGQELSGGLAAGRIFVTGSSSNLPPTELASTIRFNATNIPAEQPFGRRKVIATIDFTNMNTQSNGVISGQATGKFKDDNPVDPVDYGSVEFSLSGKRNFQKQVNTLLLKGSGANQGVTAILNLGDDGKISGSNNTLNVLGYKLKF